MVYLGKNQRIITPVVEPAVRYGAGKKQNKRSNPPSLKLRKGKGIN